MHRLSPCIMCHSQYMVYPRYCCIYPLLLPCFMLSLTTSCTYLVWKIKLSKLCDDQCLCSVLGSSRKFCLWDISQPDSPMLKVERSKDRISSYLVLPYLLVSLMAVHVQCKHTMYIGQSLWCQEPINTRSGQLPLMARMEANFICLR